MQHRVNLVSRQADERDFLSKMFSIQPSQEMAQVGVYFVTAVGQEEEERVSSTAPCQIVKKLQAGIVTPMKIFHQQADRLLARPRCKEMGQNLKAVALL